MLRELLSLAPDNVPALAALGRLAAGAGRNTEAIDLLRRASSLEPGNANLHVLLAWALPKAGLNAEAEGHLRQALELDPSISAAYGMLGFRLQERGAFDEAIANFEKGIELEPSQAGSYFGIVQSMRIGEVDRPLIERMRALLEQPRLPIQDLVFLLYALGKAHDNLGEYGTAIGHFDRANQVLSTDPAAGARPYDRPGFAAYTDRTISTFTRPFFEANQDGQRTDELPVFIVGMPRSGTTLIEQMLSCHPEIASGGELTFWRGTARTWEPGNRDAASGYLETLREISPNAKRVTDKMPINYLFLGPIHASLPRARIIHCRRNPVDTCLSIYMTRYVTPPEFANDRGNIVFGYRQYQRLMDHWRETLPPEQFLEIDYEAVVTDQERLTRQMVEFCGLDWDDACLRPEANRRNVTTPSLWQARQPVYSSSVARWRRYEPWLREFRELLD